MESFYGRAQVFVITESGRSPVIIDFGRALSSLMHARECGPIREERIDLFQSLKEVMRGGVVLQCFEGLFAQKKDDPEWKSFMLDMDERGLKEWRSWDGKWQDVSIAETRNIGRINIAEKYQQYRIGEDWIALNDDSLYWLSSIYLVRTADYKLTCWIQLCFGKDSSLFAI